MASNTQSNTAAGKSVGNSVGGVFQTIHGVGETLRANINGAIDGLGDGIANREQGSVESRTAHQASANSNASVAQKGENEIKRGIDKL